MNKTYAISDLHGCYEFWDWIKDYIDDTDTIFFLGDAIDRGDKGIKLMTDLLLDTRVTYLLGNHEEFLRNAIEGILEGHFDGQSVWMSNGGYPTYIELLDYSTAHLEWLLHKINRMQKYIRYINKNGQVIHLTHSGFDINYPEEVISNLINYEIPQSSYLWNREHFYKKWDAAKDNEYMVHGHTTVGYLLKKFNKPFNSNELETVFYCDNHKIDIDLGCYYSNRCALFDLDTFETIYFIQKETLK